MNRGEQLKHEKFAQEFVKDYNAAGAAKRAGYTMHQDPKVARSVANKLLKIPYIRARIQELEKEVFEASKVSREKILNRLLQLAFRDTRKMYDSENRLKNIEDWDDDNAAAVIGVESLEVLDGFGVARKVKFSDPKAAIDSINKMCGFNAPDKVDHTSKGQSVKPDPAVPFIDYSQLSDATIQELKNAILKKNADTKR